MVEDTMIVVLAIRQQCEVIARNIPEIKSIGNKGKDVHII